MNRLKRGIDLLWSPEWKLPVVANTCPCFLLHWNSSSLHARTLPPSERQFERSNSILGVKAAEMHGPNWRAPRLGQLGISMTHHFRDRTVLYQLCKWLWIITLPSIIQQLQELLIYPVGEGVTWHMGTNEPHGLLVIRTESFGHRDKPMTFSCHRGLCWAVKSGPWY